MGRESRERARERIQCAEELNKCKKTNGDGTAWCCFCLGYLPERMGNVMCYSLGIRLLQLPPQPPTPTHAFQLNNGLEGKSYHLTVSGNERVGEWAKQKTRKDRLGKRLKAHDKKANLLFCGYTLFDRWDEFLIAVFHTYTSVAYYTAVNTWDGHTDNMHTGIMRCVCSLCN